MRTDSASTKTVDGPFLLTDVAIGAAIRTRRGDLQQGEVAIRAGLNHRVFSRIERGERPCRVSEMDAIAKALNTTPDAMLQLILEQVAQQSAAEKSQEKQ